MRLLTRPVRRVAQLVLVATGFAVLFNTAATSGVLPATSPSTLPAGPEATRTQPATNPAATLAAYVEGLPGTDVTFKMVPIPAGRFRMGSPADEANRMADEGPQVEVDVDALYVAEREVDWAAYLQFTEQYGVTASRPAYRDPPADRRVDAVTYPTPSYDVEAGPIVQRMGGKVAGYPAVGMSRYAARQFSKWVSKRTGRFYRLPTEAEWEYACRAGSTTAYAFGDDPKRLADHGWYEYDSTWPDGDPGVHRTAAKKPNRWGLYDLHGNVGEWVADAYDGERYAKLAAKGRPVRWDEAVNWPTTRYPAVVRGGNYESDARRCRSAARFKATVTMNSDDPCLPKSAHWEASAFWVGFRLVSPVKEPTEAQKRQFWSEDQDEPSRDSMGQDRQLRELVEPGTGTPDKSPEGRSGRR